MEENIIRKLIASIKCGSCGQHYEESQIEIIERNDELWLVKVICASCHVGCTVAAIIREDKKPAVVTDLTEGEVDRFHGMASIGEEDVRDMRDFLEDFDGDFPGIFREE